MKKILTFSACLTLTFAAFANVYMDLNFSPNETSAVVSSDADCVQITVYKLTKVGANASSSQAFTGYYNASKNELTVGRFTFTVRRNMAYGQDNDYRAAYQYVAGDYYFNL